MLTYAHRCAVVTGAASGIGKAIATEFVAAGISVVGIDLQGATNAGFPMVQADLADEAAIVSAIEQAKSQLGGINLLVNSAGIEIDEALSELKADSLDRMYQVNVRGLLLMSREVVKSLTDDAGDDALRVINVASELGFLGRAGAAAYSGTKGAVIAITRSLARELGSRARVNAVAPGPIDTPLINFSAMTAAQQALECENPLGRIGQAAEVAGVACFLASSGASFVTGQCYGVDGGAAMR
ncbi:MAG: SDR family oxidoreductase [Halieaceae bacterium]|uniref:SDR family NAD(P)-dependent oxidoreductase n=1 Tax=Haliea alexandrii TaxID=2448162 RepID=UPI000F0BDA9A|nr:SDR family oxidoreductase [Haliea alexandrii]MCR9184025.1 SDR family oxidoreductase [Halieaceae bacterium]